MTGDVNLIKRPSGDPWRGRGEGGRGRGEGEGRGGGREERGEEEGVRLKVYGWLLSYFSGECLYRVIVCCHSNETPPTQSVWGNS